MNKSGRFNIDSGSYIKNIEEAFTRLLRSSYSRSLRRDSRRGTTTTRKSELSFCSW